MIGLGAVSASRRRRAGPTHGNLNAGRHKIKISNLNLKLS